MEQSRENLEFLKFLSILFCWHVKLVIILMETFCTFLFKKTSKKTFNTDILWINALANKSMNHYTLVGYAVKFCRSRILSSPAAWSWAWNARLPWYQGSISLQISTSLSSLLDLETNVALASVLITNWPQTSCHFNILTPFYQPRTQQLSPVCFAC